LDFRIYGPGCSHRILLYVGLKYLLTCLLQSLPVISRARRPRPTRAASSSSVPALSFLSSSSLHATAHGAAPPRSRRTGRTTTLPLSLRPPCAVCAARGLALAAGRPLFLSVGGGGSAPRLDLAAAHRKAFTSDEHPPGMPTPSLPSLLCETEHPNPSLIHLFSGMIYPPLLFPAYCARPSTQTLA
jgi:hypothetical protein